MGKKMKLLPSFFNKKKSAARPWQWPLCGQSKTPSFKLRAADEIFRAVNSVFFDRTLSDRVETPDSWFSNSSESGSFSTESDDEFEAKTMEMVVRGAKSDRLIFEAGESKSILEKKQNEEGNCESNRFEESVIVEMESGDPYLDFRNSMEEMIQNLEIKDWKSLEELLNWYLSVNRTKNHGYILCAFVDLLIEFGAGDSANST